MTLNKAPFLLTFAQLARLRNEIARALPGSCTLESASRVTDGAGGWSEVWTSIGTVACRLDPVGGESPADDLLASAAMLEQRYRLTVPHDAPIAPGGRVRVNGTTYQIVRVEIDHDWRVARRAIVARSTAGTP